MNWLIHHWHDLDPMIRFTVCLMAAGVFFISAIIAKTQIDRDKEEKL